MDPSRHLLPGCPRPTRRGVLGAASFGLLAASTAGCGLLSNEPSGGGGSHRQGSAADEATEAPALADQVRAGSLPPLSERLPKNPLVVQPTEGSGRYGGTWHDAIQGSSDTAWLTRTLGYEPLLRWNPPWTKVVPNVAESVEVSDDGRVFTIVLRKGMRWSDGEPFTADDLLFAYHDVVLNTDLTPLPPSFLLNSTGEPAELEKLDETRARLSFDVPSGLFLSFLADSYKGTLLLAYPRHYLAQFHASHNPDVKQQAKDSDFDSWVDLFYAKASTWQNKDVPRLHAWVITTELGAANRVVAERNPYYWKTDPDGRQLPYLDRVVYPVLPDTQTILLKATNGDLDFHTRHINILTNKPVLARNREHGQYHFTTLVSSSNNQFVLDLNLAHPDPVKREIFGNRDFRIGLSYAINRQEMIEAIFQRQGEPWQVAPARESQFYDEEMAKQYTEFSVEKANEHLDRAGYDRRDTDGFRLGPDGKRISFAVDARSDYLFPWWPDATDMVTTYWKRVGVEAHTRTESGSLFSARMDANKHDAAAVAGDDAGLKDEMFDCRHYFPFNDESRWALPWAAWFGSQGKAGEEPPAAPKKQMELYNRLLRTPSEQGRADLFKQILAITKEQFWVIGTVRIPEGYGIVKNNFRNVPDSIPDSWIYVTPGPTNPPQYYVDQE